METSCQGPETGHTGRHAARFQGEGKRHTEVGQQEQVQKRGLCLTLPSESHVIAHCGKLIALCHLWVTQDKKDHKHLVSLVMSPAVLRFYFVVMEVEALQLEYRSPARAVAACPGSTVDACK